MHRRYVMLTGPRLTGDMPILGNPGMLPVPGGVIAPHETRARINHGQTLGRLKQRGGLSVSEVVAILEGRPWRRMGEIQAVDRLADRDKVDHAKAASPDQSDRRSPALEHRRIQRHPPGRLAPVTQPIPRSPVDANPPGTARALSRPHRPCR